MYLFRTESVVDDEMVIPKIVYQSKEATPVSEHIHCWSCTMHNHICYIYCYVYMCTLP